MFLNTPCLRHALGLPALEVDRLLKWTVSQVNGGEHRLWCSTAATGSVEESRAVLRVYNVAAGCAA